MATNLSLLSSLNRIETPSIKVTIGEHTFGVYSKKDNEIVYPNFIQSLQVKRVNGQVNTYTLVMSYPITEKDDPNFFDKVLSSVSKTRKIIISCGDLSNPFYSETDKNYTYSNEEALITSIQERVNVKSAVIQYTINAVSSAYIMKAGAFTFSERVAKPSDVIKELLQTRYYGLTDIFTGMKDYDTVLSQGLIPGDDDEVLLELQTNVSVLDYLSYLVGCMKTKAVVKDSIQQGVFYVLTIVDGTTTAIKDEKNNFTFNGPYFKIVKSAKDEDAYDVYNIDIGFPSKDIVTSFDIIDNDNYTLLYDYQGQINENKYVQRIDDNGKFEQVYAPVISSGNSKYRTTEYDKTWWTKVTEFPIKASITLKGLLRPAILMSHVRVNMYFYGRKYAYGSGLYIITEHVDNIDSSGFRTTLQLTRVGGDREYQSNTSTVTTSKSSSGSGYSMMTNVNSIMSVKD